MAGRVDPRRVASGAAAGGTRALVPLAAGRHRHRRRALFRPAGGAAAMARRDHAADHGARRVCLLVSPRRVRSRARPDRRDRPRRHPAGLCRGWLARPSGRRARAREARRLLHRSPGPAGRGPHQRPTPDARGARDRRPRPRGHAGADPGERADEGGRGGAGRSRASAGHAHAALAAGRAARLRFRPACLVRGARRRGLRAPAAGAALEAPLAQLVARSARPAPSHRGGDHRRRPRRRGRDRGGASGRPARRAPGRDLGGVGDHRNRPPSVHLRAAPGAGGRDPVLLGSDRTSRSRRRLLCACPRRRSPPCSP